MLAGSPAALRAYARFRSELRHGDAAADDPAADRARRRRAPGQRVRASPRSSARRARPGLGLDEIALAREFDSRDEREAALLRFVKALLETDGRAALHLHEEAREAGWDDEQILEAVAHVALDSFANLVTRAGDVPVDGSAEEARLAPGRLRRGRPPGRLQI